ncbi:helix-turn-helix transcriptional regulator [Streptomyces lateritius]|uniref:helix-turn-helix transcriptional regulator n=1 Tax=Streptomyces lateritius TaxID=67313 RepID=UPI00167A118D|nr:WYL domain-containing protein [Streptomyces lateritius]GGU13321.1 transcriptional regulator [Streptomyces lateritius]
MKADRLMATLLFLQSRGRVTVREVAAELEVSERTARRDLESLTVAGVPVYSQRGRGGGWSLVGGARTDLTGFTQREIGALFLAAGPLSASPELRTALRKLVQAVPAPMRRHAEAAAKALVVDGLDWSRAAVRAGGGPHHHALEQAVLDRVRITLGYADAEPAPAAASVPARAPASAPESPPAPGPEPSPDASTVREWTVDPLGLVWKAGCWYLVAATEEGLRSFRHTRVISVVDTGEPARRPEGFDLAAAWQSLAADVERRLRTTTVRAVADPSALPVLHELLGERLRTGRELSDGRRHFEADGPSLDLLAAQLAGFGARVEVLGPPEARARMARLGHELTAAHAGSGRPEAHVPPSESHFPLGTYYPEDASVVHGTARKPARPSRRHPRQRLSPTNSLDEGAVS